MPFSTPDSRELAEIIDKRTIDNPNLFSNIEFDSDMHVEICQALDIICSGIVRNHTGRKL